MRTWALPEHIEDLLPANAARLEALRRAALDLFAAHGYELVMPPLLEFVESLLSGTGRDMDLATFKLVDQISGRLMGIRADTTPQVARIDAHILNRQGVARLCYAGSVLHTRPVGLGKSRQPFQVGAELYGHSGLEADLEIQTLALELTRALGIESVALDIGHPAIFRELLQLAAIEGEAAERIRAAVENKDLPGLEECLPRDMAAAQPLRALARLAGGTDTIQRARATLPATPALSQALDQLDAVAAHFGRRGVEVSVDLGELGGFNYESGLAFSIYAAGAADAIARGGRYDEVGKAFGRARPATGFSMDLKALLPLVDDAPARGGILGPAQPDAAALAAMARLRAAGERVVARLPGHEAHIAELGCDRQLVWSAGEWRAVRLEAAGASNSANGKEPS
jgi:ATP phosphoribosyltransferase regulatory subunit